MLVPAGNFTMGDDDVSPRREVYLDALYLDNYEVTTARYAKFLQATGSVRQPEEWENLDLARGGLLVIGSATQCRLRRRAKPRPARATPRSVRVAGSGTEEAEVMATVPTQF